MKNLKSKIRDFLDSEEGRVGVKTPLTLGVAAGGILLAYAGTAPEADAWSACSSDGDCNDGQECEERCFPVYVGNGSFECEYHHVCVAANQ